MSRISGQELWGDSAVVWYPLAVLEGRVLLFCVLIVVASGVATWSELRVVADSAEPRRKGLPFRRVASRFTRCGVTRRDKCGRSLAFGIRGFPESFPLAAYAPNLTSLRSCPAGEPTHIPVGCFSELTPPMLIEDVCPAKPGKCGTFEPSCPVFPVRGADEYRSGSGVNA